MTNNCKKVLLQKRAASGKNKSLWRRLIADPWQEHVANPAAKFIDEVRQGIDAGGGSFFNYSRTPQNAGTRHYPSEAERREYLRRQLDVRRQRGKDLDDPDFVKSQNEFASDDPKRRMMRVSAQAQYEKHLAELARIKSRVAKNPEYESMYKQQMEDRAAAAAALKEAIAADKKSRRTDSERWFKDNKNSWTGED